MKKTCVSSEKRPPASNSTLGLARLNETAYVSETSKLGETLASAVGHHNVECGVYGIHRDNSELYKQGGFDASPNTQDQKINGNIAIKSLSLPIENPRHVTFNLETDDENLQNACCAVADTESLSPEAVYVEANTAFVYDRVCKAHAEDEYVDFDANRLCGLNDSEIDSTSDDHSDHIYESLEEYQRPNENDNSIGSPGSQSSTTADLKRNTRICVVKELIKTEEDYLHNLDVIVDNIMKPLSERDLPPGVKLEILFGNIEEVRKFSHSFLTSLKSAVDDLPLTDVHIVKVFLDNATKMKEVYKVYCRNYDDSIALMGKYKNEANFVLPVRECLNNIKDKVESCGIESLLIQPVQRIWKYPLLLKELLKATPPPQPSDDASYYRELIMADKVANDVASAINEAQRGKELIKRYRLKNGITRRNGRFIQGFKKKTTRFAMKIGHAMNKCTIVDAEFDKTEQKFKNMEVVVNNFIQNCDIFLKDYQELLSCERSFAEEMVNFYASSQTRLVTSFVAAMKRIADDIFIEFQNDVHHQILTPMNKLCKHFTEPQPIIDKRADKLLDYENCLLNSDCKVSLEESKNVYEALNRQLLDDLPKFCELTSKLINACLAKFFELEMRFLRDSLQVIEDVFKMYPNTDGVVEELGRRNISEKFTFVQNQLLLQMKVITIIPSSFTDKPNLALDRMLYSCYSGSPVTHGKFVRQSSSQQQNLMKKYQKIDLFVVTRSYSSLRNIDISCSCNSLVGVINRQDPTGICDMWLCDNGAAQGLLPNNILKSYLLLSNPAPKSVDSVAFSQRPEVYSSYYLNSTPSPTPTPAPTPSPSSAPTSASTHSQGPSVYSLREGLYGEMGESPSKDDYANIGDTSQLDDVFQEEEEMLDDTEYGEIDGTRRSDKSCYRVEFTHNSRSCIELSVTKGDLVSVILKHDKDGNTDWWMVADKHGTQGYVPYNFLKQIQ